MGKFFGFPRCAGAQAARDRGGGAGRAFALARLCHGRPRRPAGGGKTRGYRGTSQYRRAAAGALSDIASPGVGPLAKVALNTVTSLCASLPCVASPRQPAPAESLIQLCKF